MVLLHSNKLENIPKDAVIFTEDEALKYQWDEISNHDSLSKTWSLQYGAGVLGVLSGLTGVYINHHYRGRLRLGSFGAFSTYLPIVVLPTLVTTAFHKVFVQSDIILRKTKCPVCLQVQAAATQVALGIGYPSILAPIAAYMFATRHFTYRLPPISKYKELFATYKKMTRPLSTALSISLGIHVLIAMALTQKEILDFHRLEQDSATEELLS
ncbi:uncharacterized protein LOC119068502 [Bradysia coprophila]|uniref:uncharacterized protein LOC119068502 n=1 Tax=Bradysia coprophila TaxID=38358 RepID=UPI00187D7E86|nr:uncharacterized protein LOC119068502 [Bradysia coprophila]